MKIIRADSLGMCFGVKDAIALAVETARHEPLTILGDLVHNQTVLAELKQQGVLDRRTGRVDPERLRRQQDADGHQQSLFHDPLPLASPVDLQAHVVRRAVGESTAILAAAAKFCFRFSRFRRNLGVL